MYIWNFKALTILFTMLKTVYLSRSKDIHKIGGKFSSAILARKLGWYQYCSSANIISQLISVRAYLKMVIWVFAYMQTKTRVNTVPWSCQTITGQRVKSVLVHNDWLWSCVREHAAEWMFIYEMRIFHCLLSSTWNSISVCKIKSSLLSCAFFINQHHEKQKCLYSHFWIFLFNMELLKPCY